LNDDPALASKQRTDRLTDQPTKQAATLPANPPTDRPTNHLRPQSGISWATLWLPITQDSSFSAGHVLLLLAADVPLYAALTSYLDKVGYEMTSLLKPAALA
jgi:hypothetical protein